MTPKELTRPRILLIDDDAMFGSIMATAAKRHGVDLDYYTSLLDLGYVGRFEDYSAAIVDYDLGNMNGLEIGDYFASFLRETPIVLVSGSDLATKKPWAASIKSFVHKDRGYDEILNAVVETLRPPVLTPMATDVY